MSWRGWFRLVHRDLGYTAAALTLAYALSGLAVNHIDDWNPNYRFATRELTLGPIPGATAAERASAVVAALRLPAARVRGHLQESARLLRIYLPDGEEVSLDVTTGVGQHKLVERRPLLFQVNALHLNNLKGAWTYVADVFAVALMLLALTGISMMKGKPGFWGRGKYFFAAGLAIPIAALFYLAQ